MFASSLKNTPLFNTPEIKALFQKPIPFDERFLLRALEMIAYPGTVFKIESKKGDVAQVSTKEYPSNRPLYIDTRFVAITEEEPPERERILPPKEEIIRRLETFPKGPYIWGGNVPEGIPELFELFPPSELLTPFERRYLQFKGVDCSGLLYHVTNGFTPRNSKEIAEKSTQVERLEPLDLVLYPGHLLIALPGSRLIESREFDGLIISDASTRLKELEGFSYWFGRWI